MRSVRINTKNSTKYTRVADAAGFSGYPSTAVKTVLVISSDKQTARIFACLLASDLRITLLYQELSVKQSFVAVSTKSGFRALARLGRSQEKNCSILFLPMNTTVQRLSDRLAKRDFHHAFGRFKLVRQAYSLYQNRRQRFHADFHERRLSPRKLSLFPDVSTENCLQALTEKGVSFGFGLPADKIKRVLKFAEETLCYEPGFADEFYARDVQFGKLNGGRHVFRGLVKNPENCSVMTELAQDPILLKIVRSYLKYWPSKLTYHLTWSFPVDLPLLRQQQIYPPLNYHYDVAGYNFMTTYFYITDVDVTSGAHVMITKSHNHKPPGTLFISGKDPQIAQQAIAHYPKEDETVIEGKAGFGFMQDPSCFHKLLPPVNVKRLLLQIRYS